MIRASFDNSLQHAPTTAVKVFARVKQLLGCCPVAAAGMVCVWPYLNLLYRANGLDDAQIGVLAGELGRGGSVRQGAANGWQALSSRDTQA